MLLGTLGASLLGNILAGKGINKKGNGTNKAGEGAIAESVSEETKSTRQGRGIVRASYGHRSLNSSKNKKGQKDNKMDF